MLEIALLGPLEVKHDGETVHVPGGKASELFVRLALEPGSLVSADRLIDDLWAADGVNTRRNTLQSKVARLRRAFADPSVIASFDGGYALAVTASNVDALAVLDDASMASQLLDAGDGHGAAHLAETAVARFGADLLPAAGDGDWVRPHRTRLDETRMRLIEIQYTARLGLGDLGGVIGELEALVVVHPFQEALWALLITALYRAGRQADALAAYQRVKRQLADELGLDPGAALQRLEQEILNQDDGLGSPHLALEAVGNLPSMSAELIGRADDVTNLVDLLARQRLVEIIGPGGIGKSAIAIAVGRALSSSSSVGAGGVWLARLETANSADDVIDTLVAALNAPGEAALFERLKARAALVILDNCEHVIDEASDLAARLLDAAPGLRILCTSQVRLDVDGESTYDLAPLGLDDAAALFMRRAAAQRVKAPSPDRNAAVLGLCRALDGLPLAIELAAARTKTLSVEEITRRLDDRFVVLSDPTSRKPERRRSLRSTIRWSYELLFPDDQRGLWALATFADGAPLPAVESVLEALDVPAAAAIDVLGRLVSRSMVYADEDDAPPSMASGGRVDGVRYRLLDSIRAFAWAAMTDAGTSEAGRSAHAAWFAAAAETSTEGVRSAHQSEYLAFARAERANIDAALAWSVECDPQLALSIANGFGWAWVVLGDSRGAQRILTALEAADDVAPAEERVKALLLAAWIEASTGHLEPARKHIATATSLSDSIELQARCAYHLAYVVSHQGDFQRASDLTDLSRAAYDDLDRPWDQAANGLFAARAAISAGDERRSVAAVADVRRWLRMVDDPWLHVRAEAMLGELARMQGRFADAVVHIDRAARTSRRLGFLQTEAYQVTILGRAQCQTGDYEAGAATLQLAIDKARTVGDVRLVALAQVHLGRVLRAMGQSAQAREALEAATSWHRSAGGGEQALLGESLLAAMDAAEGYPGARERLLEIVDTALQVDDPQAEVFALDALARIAIEADDPSGRDLLDAADQRMVAASHLITELDRTDARVVRAYHGEPTAD